MMIQIGKTLWTAWFKEKYFSAVRVNDIEIDKKKFGIGAELIK